MTTLDILQGSRLEQKCLFIPGNPEQTYFRWTRSTNTNPWKVQTDQTLVINNVSLSDDGNYTCQVYNMLNPTVGTSVNCTDENWFLLNVLYGAEKMTFSTDIVPGKETFNVSENTKMSLTCKVESNPGSYMNISKAGEVVRTLTNTKVISHQLNGKCEDAGVYTCVGHNQYPGSHLQSIDIRVLCSPRHAPGEVVRNITSWQHDTPTIKLAIQAYPTPTHRWAKCLNGTCTEMRSSDKYILSSDGLEANLTVVNVEQADFGQYQLTAMNGVGNYNEVVWLIPTDKVSSASSSNAGLIAGSIVGGLIGLLVVVMTVVALRKYELMCMCKCARKPESTGKALSEASAVSTINTAEYESIGNRNDIRRDQPDINSSGKDNELGTNAYDSLDAHQSSKHVYSELGRQPRTDQTRLYENKAVHLDSGTAVYVNTTFENA